VTLRFISVCVFTIFLTLAVACSKRNSQAQLRVEVPAGFTGNFVLDMGVREAPPLQKDGAAYLVSVPRSGKVETSTILDAPHVTFKNSSDGQIWGYSERIFSTGDGISTGGKIEFFVGTRKDFEAEQNKKNKSGGSLKTESAFSAA
jgi:hypothetical protein